MAEFKPERDLDGERGLGAHILVYTFVIVPFIALLAAIPVAWMLDWISWLDIILAVAFYVIACLGVTVGYHRYFTHGAFKAKRWLRIVLALAGQLGSQGAPITWVADHRRHHAFADKEGDPHSPWLFGTSPLALVKGFWHAHMGWLFDRDETNAKRFVPDLLADRDIVRANGMFAVMTAVNFLLPAVLGGLITMSWMGALTAFFWAGLVRVSFLHHITWSTNSVCHMVGVRPFTSRDKATNFWPLAILSMGESWHNLHHADPTSARHGVKRGQIDISARVIWLFEKFGWVHSVRWPTKQRLASIAAESG